MSEREQLSAGEVSRALLLMLAFVEGGSVMACELLAAKLSAPYFGNSLYVWAAVLGVTLLALMSGYYFGGWCSAQVKRKGLLYAILCVAGGLLIIMPYTGEAIMMATIEMSVRSGATFSLLVFMFPQLMLMGMSSPLIINLLNEHVDESGRTAGSVYAISTLGGIIATFLMGFYMIPEMGLKLPALIFGVLLLVISLLCWLKSGVRKSSVAVMLLPVGVFAYEQLRELPEGGGVRIIHLEEGIMGQIKVDEADIQTPRGPRTLRTLMVNNQLQSRFAVGHPHETQLPYVYAMLAAATKYEKGSKALLLGIGGGSLLLGLERLGFDVESVELDERIHEVAMKYFEVSPDSEVHIDDARRFINNATGEYDMIFVDAFLNESPAEHMMSIEAFQRMNELLSDDGSIILNFSGFLRGENGLATRCLIKTLMASGLNVRIWATPGKESQRNILMLASRGALDFSEADYLEDGVALHFKGLNRYFMKPENLDLSDALVFSDAQPHFAHVYVDVALEWRRIARDFVIKRYLANDLPMTK